MVAGIILAGGQSRRVGQDKLLLPLAGVPLIEHALAAVRDVADETIVVGRRYPGVRDVADQWPDAGPLGGLISGLLATREEIALVVAADLPFLNVDLLRRLVGFLGRHDAVVPRAAGREQPLHAVYRRDRAATGAQLILSGERRLTTFVDHLNTRWVDPDEMSDLDPRMRSFTNVNTMSDLTRVQQSAG